MDPTASDRDAKGPTRAGLALRLAATTLIAWSFIVLAVTLGDRLDDDVPILLGILAVLVAALAVGGLPQLVERLQGPKVVRLARGRALAMLLPCTAGAFVVLACLAWLDDAVAASAVAAAMTAWAVAAPLIVRPAST